MLKCSKAIYRFYLGLFKYNEGKFRLFIIGGTSNIMNENICIKPMTIKNYAVLFKNHWENSKSKVLINAIFLCFVIMKLAMPFGIG